MAREWLLVVWAQYDEMTQHIADQMAALPWPQSRVSPNEGAASTLRNSWEEFAREVQEDQSFYWDVYEDQIRLFISRLVEELDWQDTALLWCATDESYEKSDEDWALERSEMREAIEEYLWKSINNLAGSYDLNHYFDWYEEDPEEEEDNIENDDTEESDNVTKVEQPSLFKAEDEIRPSP